MSCIIKTLNALGISSFFNVDVNSIEGLQQKDWVYHLSSVSGILVIEFYLSNSMDLLF